MVTSRLTNGHGPDPAALCTELFTLVADVVTGAHGTVVYAVSLPPGMTALDICLTPSLLKDARFFLSVD